MSLPRGKIQGTDAEIAGTRFAAKRSSHKPYSKNFGRSPSDFRFGSKADISRRPTHVRFTSESGHLPMSALVVAVVQANGACVQALAEHLS